MGVHGDWLSVAAHRTDVLRQVVGMRRQERSVVSRLPGTIAATA
jgi:hypothetical protein